MSSVGGVVSVAGTAGADPATPAPAPPPAPVPVSRPMPADPARINPIGGARISSTTPQGETAGMERPLAAQGERGAATVPMWAKDGVHLATSWPLHNVVWHLPDELTLAPAAWTGDGGAVYSSPDVDYLIRPYAGSGADIVVTRKSLLSSSTIPFGVRLPDGTHFRNDGHVILIESDAHPGSPASTVATISIPTAKDANGVPLQVTPTLAPGFPPGQQNIVADLGPANPLAFPVTVTIAYRPGELPTAGAFTPDWQGTPPGIQPPNVVTNPQDYVNDPQGRYRPAGTDPILYGQRHSGGCVGGADNYTSADGRTANFQAACQRHQMCLDVAPSRTSPASCDGILLSDMSIQCMAAFGQGNDENEACMRTASDHVAWVKANMLPGPLCQPVTQTTNTNTPPATGNRYCTA